MNILFLSISTAVSDINNRGIYPDLLRKFAQEGHEVYIVSPYERRFNKKTNYTQNNNIHTLGVKTLNITKSNLIEKGIGTLLIEKQFKKAINKYFSNHHFDLILYSTPPITFGTLISYLKKKHNAKTYLLLKDIFPQNAVDLGLIKRESLLHKYFRKKEKKLYQISDYIGCMSPANVDYLIKNHNYLKNKNIEECPNSIELENFIDLTQFQINEIKSKFKIPNNVILVVYGGNLGKPQGIDFLIDILETNNQNKELFFVIAGNGTEFLKLSQWIKKRNPNNIILYESLPKQDFDQLVAISDITLILLSNKFTIPNYPSRLLTNLSFKKPILIACDQATDIGKIAEANGYGLTCYSGDIVSFNKNILRLAKDKKLREEMGISGFNFLKQNYTTQNSYNIIMKHFI